ncbi:MAG: DUF3078 domain-containing protein [Flavobacteriales bacterium]|nr:DUF3078 domain-containing protein [Flavobacteriales bacterium]MCX7768180.1 DUF3078 domain-containing protein [Flavobacteriales bacterium]MDW8409131.1 DUF3078 domain-containing protein [Flavobacteriales bacterium]
MKGWLYAIIMALVGPSLTAQKEKKDTIRHWRWSAIPSVNINQAFFSDSWTGGGISSIALAGNFDGFAEYTKNQWTWGSTAAIRYGLIRNKGQEWRKNLDVIDLATKLDYKFSKSWRAFINVTHLNQFAPGYRFLGVFDSLGREQKIRISSFCAPCYLNENIGIEFRPWDKEKSQPVKWFYANLGFLALRQTFVIDNALFNTVAANYGVSQGRKMRNQLGFSLEFGINRDLAKHVNLLFRYRLFNDYRSFKPADMIHRADLTFSAFVLKFLKVTLTGVMMYDIAMDKRVQWNQGLAIGIGYRFANFEEKK